jgi:hypothetical protein
MHHFHFGAQDIQHPTFKAFENGSLNGIHNLTPSLTINSATATPTFAYKASDATNTSWPAWDFGSTLTAGGSGGQFNTGSPLMGIYDTSVSPNATRNWSGATGSNITTGDYVIEAVFQASFNLSTFIAAKGTATPSWGLRIITGGTRVDWSHADGVGSLTLRSGNLTSGYWYHVLIFVNRDENSTNGSQMYVNGVASGSGVNASTSPNTLANAQSLFLAATGSGANIYDSRISYIAVWERANWFAAGATGPAQWAEVARERFLKLTGVWPSKTESDPRPFNFARASGAYVDKAETEAGSIKRRLYQVGDNWVRTASRVAKTNGRVISGLNSEQTLTNFIAQSKDFNNGQWVKGDATVSGNVELSPTRDLDADSLFESAVVSGQYMTNMVTSGTLTNAGNYTVSVFAKAANRHWIRLSTFSDPTNWAYFALSGVNGLVGTTNGTGPAIIENWGDGWYRCQYPFTKSGNTVSTMQVNLADNDNNIVFDGTYQSGVHLWGAQLELQEYASSPIDTTTSTAQRLMDRLTYHASGTYNNHQGRLDANILSVDYNMPTTNTAQPILGLLNDNGVTDWSIMTINGQADALRCLTRASGVTGFDQSTSTNPLVAGHDITDGDQHNVQYMWTNVIGNQQNRMFRDGAQATVSGTGTSMGDSTVYIIPGWYGYTVIGGFTGLINNCKVYKRFARKR